MTYTRGILGSPLPADSSPTSHEPRNPCSHTIQSSPNSVQKDNFEARRELRLCASGSSSRLSRLREASRLIA